jgi:hypothetical protein
MDCIDAKSIRARREAGTAHQIIETMLTGILGQRIPEHSQHDTATMGGIYTSPANLQEPTREGQNASQMKFALGVEAPEPSRGSIREKPRTPDNVVGM